MKRLWCLFLCITSSVVSMYRPLTFAANNSSNMQLCMNYPRTFGTTHFIVGCKDPDVYRKQQELSKVLRSKNKVSLDRASYIDKNRVSQSFFTTIHDLSPIILSIMADTEKCLLVAAFTLTDKRIADQLIDAHNNGVEVCVITDEGNMKQPFSRIAHIVDKNVPVWCYNPKLHATHKNNRLFGPLMHHKIIICDDLVVTGSANLTHAGQKKNIENITILRDRQTVEEHRAEFERLKKYCIKCVPHVAA